MEQLARENLIDVVFIFMLLEWVVLSAVIGRRRPAFRALALMPNLLSGASLVLALRFALADAQFTAVLICLVASLVFHGLDLLSRSRL